MLAYVVYSQACGDTIPLPGVCAKLARVVAEAVGTLCYGLMLAWPGRPWSVGVDLSAVE